MTDVRPPEARSGGAQDEPHGRPLNRIAGDLYGRGVNMQCPSAARMFDYCLGGTANFAVDRQAVDRLLPEVPEIQVYARATRAFLCRVIRFLCDRGIDQFLDLGSGMPTVGNVHEIAGRRRAGARVAYVDVEPEVVSHSKELLRGTEGVTVTQADMREPEAVLAAPGVAGLLDFSRPIAVLAVSVLPYVPDADDPPGIVRRYRDNCAPGSYLAVSHGAPLTMSVDQVRSSEYVYQSTHTPLTMRSPERIRSLLPGYELLEPGLVPLPEWRPEPDVNAAQDSTRSANGLAAVGYLPHEVLDAREG
ncbi:SAM-dependent methyltransferase [Actinopolyspora saharensis]|uniref:SAM-dependent methyltransferase n=1 Tax=Actinopolyspora saharensis TaxID=995062 RepID=UPI003F673370